MKRDMDLVRKILLAIEADPTGWIPSPLEVDGYDNSQIGYHVMLMCQAGLLGGHDHTGTASTGPEWDADCMTWEGHEFLESARSESTWQRVKSAVSSGAGGMSLTILKGVLTAYGTAEAMKHLPVK